MYKLLYLIALCLRLATLVGAGALGVVPWNSTSNGTAEHYHLDGRALSGVLGFKSTTWPDGTVRRCNDQDFALSMQDPYEKGVLTPHEIRYCYASVAARTQLKPSVDAAIQLWMNALGGPASAATRHGLSLTEVVDVARNPMYCFYSDYQSYEQPGTWHGGIWKGALAIHVAPPPRGASASCGFRLNGDREHNLVTSTANQAGLTSSIAHEVSEKLCAISTASGVYI